MTLIIPSPFTRIKDCFVEENSKIDFSEIIQNFNHPIVEGMPNIDHRFVADFYKKIGVDIVAETAFDYPYPFITEKTYRSMIMLRPFIIVGPCCTLHFLKSIGFKTFSSIINESYDLVQQPEQRFIEVCESIRSFVTRPIQQIQKDLRSITDVLKYNQLHLLRLSSLELEKFKIQLSNDQI